MPCELVLTEAKTTEAYPSTGGTMLNKLNKFGMLSAFIIGAWAVGFLMGGGSFERYDRLTWQALEWEVADQSEQIEKLKISNFMLEANLNQLQGAAEIDAGAPTLAPPAKP